MNYILSGDARCVLCH